MKWKHLQQTWWIKKNNFMNFVIIIQWIIWSKFQLEHFKFWILLKMSQSKFNLIIYANLHYCQEDKELMFVQLWFKRLITVNDTPFIYHWFPLILWTYISKGVSSKQTSRLFLEFVQTCNFAKVNEWMINTDFMNYFSDNNGLRITVEVFCFHRNRSAVNAAIS